MELATTLGYSPCPMKSMRRGAVGAVVGILGLAACDPAPPPEGAPSGPVRAEPLPDSKTLADLVREQLAEVLRDGDAYSRARGLGTLLPTMGPELVPAIQQTLNSRLLDYRAAELDLLLRFWATHEPEQAALWAKDLAPPDYRAAAVFTALRTWAELDPEAASSAAWMWGVDDLALERAAPIALVRGWYAADDPSGLSRWISALPPGYLRQRAIAAHLRILIEREGPTAAIRWAEGVPDEPVGYKLAVFRRLTDTLATMDVEAATAFCETHCQGPYGSNMRSLIGRKWVVRDGPAALAWLSAAARGTERDLAVRVTFAKWARLDREAALAWMTTQTVEEPGPWLAPVYPVYARLLAEIEPREAIGWAQRIEKAEVRQSVLIDVARVWRHLDERAAEEWLLQSSLPPQALESVRAPIGEGPRRQRLEAAISAADDEKLP